jgi:hypothetical protein
MSRWREVFSHLAKNQRLARDLGTLGDCSALRLALSSDPGRQFSCHAFMLLGAAQ